MLSSCKNWLRPFRSTAVGARKKRPRSCSFTLELLEDRVTPTATLGTASLLEGPGAGTDTDIVVTTGAWSASSNAGWLHTSSSGVGNGMATLTFDANAGASRTGTLLVAGQTLTVTQAGASYVAVNVVSSVITSGLTTPLGITFDASGNLYIADGYAGSVVKWNPSSGQLTTLFSGLTNAFGVAVDASNNVYVLQATSTYGVRKFNPTTQTLTPLISSGVFYPEGIAIDAAGDLYIADTSDNVVKVWNAATQQLSTLISTGLSDPTDVVLDLAGNLYITDANHSAVKEWSPATGQLTTLVTGLNFPDGVAVDGSGNVYFTDTYNNKVGMWSAATGQTTTLVSTGLNRPFGIALDANGNIYFTDEEHSAVKEIIRSYVPTAPISEAPVAGSDFLAAVLPTTVSLTGTQAPTSDQPWLSIGAVNNGVVHFSFTANTGYLRTGHINLLGQQITVTQAGSTVLGTASLLEGPGAGTDTDIVVTTGAWSASSNAGWLHTSSSGVGNGMATLTFDANAGASRTGTLLVAGQTLTVTQAGASYVAVNVVSSVITSGLTTPLGITFDASGNLYIADGYAGSVVKWNPSSGQLTTLFSGLTNAFGVAVDASNNVYVLQATSTYGVRKFNPTTQTLTPLISSGVFYPEGIAIDAAGDLYIADTSDNVVKVWNAATQQLSTLISTGLSDPTDVVLDLAGNLYITDANHSAVKEWSPATGQLTTLVTGLNFPDGVAVDGSGNVYFTDTYNNKVGMWSAATGQTTTLVSTGLNRPFGIALDANGNIYFTDEEHSAVKEIIRSYVPTAPISEAPVAGSDFLAAVLPTTVSLTGTQAPTSDQPWLSIGAVNNGVVHFAFTANTGVTRTAHLSLLGQTITVTQSQVISLGTTALLEGPAAGPDTDIVVTPVAWSATSNVSWLHTTSSGPGNGLVTFTFDANTGATRSGAITIAGQSLFVTQAGSWYVQSNAVITVASGFSNPSGVAVDVSGNVYIADSSNNAIKMWNATTQQVTTLISSGLTSPSGLTLDAAGNLFIADFGDGTIDKWNAGTQQLTTLVSTGIVGPFDVAVDGSGNLYIADPTNHSIDKWNVSTQQLTTLYTNSHRQLAGVAVDAAGNVYFSDFANNVIEVWSAATQQVTTLIATGLNGPTGLRVDGSGNLYIANYLNGTVNEWNPVTRTLATLLSAGTELPQSLALDSSGNVYWVDTQTNSLHELVGAYVPTNSVNESSASGSAALLPVLPATTALTGIFAPETNQPWLTIGSTTQGTVNFSFAANTGTPRSAQIKLLGQQITVNQAGLATLSQATATNVTSNTATLGGTVSDDGGSSLTKRGILYSLTTTNANPALGGTGVLEVDDASTTAGIFTDSVTGLSYATDYSYVAFATNSVGTSYSTVATFTTLPVAPTLAGPAYSSVTSTTAVMGGVVTSDGGTSITKRGVLYSPTATNANPTLGGAGVLEIDAPTQATGLFTVSANNLAFATGYSFVAFATNSVGISYSAVVAFATPAVAPIVSAPSSTGITSGLATLGGTVTGTGGASLIKRGILYAPTALNGNPTLGGSGVIEVDDVAATTGVFSRSLTGLTPNTAYSFVAFATSNAGVGYSSVASFATTLYGPASDINGPTSAFPGQAITFTLNAYDPAPGMQLYYFVFHIKWGDGKTDAVTGLNGTTIAHTYATTGSYTIQMSATDGRGATLATDTQVETIAYAFMQGSSLLIQGTSGNDTIALSAPGAGAVGVVVNGVNQGTFAPTTGILVQTSGGADTLVGPNSSTPNLWTLAGARTGTLTNSALPAPAQFSGIANLTGGSGPDTFAIQNSASGFDAVNGGSGGNTLDYATFTSGVSVNLSTGAATKLGAVSNISIVIGGSGNDSLTGGSGGSVLFGGIGNDTLRAGSGRSLLVGGSGADSLTGGSGDTILIGGQLSYFDEANDILDAPALNGILAEWLRTDLNLIQRLTNLSSGGGLNGGAVLNASTISDDGAIDKLFEGSAGQDWFLMFANDQKQGNGAGDAVTNF